MVVPCRVTAAWFYDVGENGRPQVFRSWNSNGHGLTPVIIAVDASLGRTALGHLSVRFGSVFAC